MYEKGGKKMENDIFELRTSCLAFVNQTSH
jgi:hypothetical protein